MKGVIRYLTGCCSLDKNGDNDGITKVIYSKKPVQEEYYIKKNTIQHEFSQHDEMDCKWDDNSPAVKLKSNKEKPLLEIKPSDIFSSEGPSKMHLRSHDVVADDFKDDANVGVYGTRLLNNSAITINDIKAVFS